MSNSIKRGKFKIYLGYAPGVGKTYTMLKDANEMLQAGEDIVIGYLETHGRIDTEEQIKDLLIVPRKKIEYKDKIFEELDKDKIIEINPRYVLIDELAHTNVPNSKNIKRYEDIEEILEYGINVISTLNIQHLESLNDVVERITEISIKETIPDYVLNSADEIVFVDLTPDALINRLARGKIYNIEIIGRALSNFFRKGNLTALREMALIEASMGTSKYLNGSISECFGEKVIRRDKVVVCVSSNPKAINLIRRGARISKALECDFVVVAVECTHRFAPEIREKDRDMLEKYRRLAISVGGSFKMLKGNSVSKELSKFIKSIEATQVIIGKSKRTKLQTILRGSTISKLLKYSREVEYHIIPY
ncbi:universal stress protein [Clostridium sp. C8-1-8]|uniref:universal stress protein n=1 Tax=Clostridium sp. C8-1-8 TaxID=2698831 RepID=UPI00136ED5D5|nr:universal stress protein [Clostridium sp. C8-1-8]